MRISLNWLAELVALPPLAELSERLTQGGLEVERIEQLGAELEGVVVAQILASQPHPKADRLSVTEVLAGTERLQIVCGAKNYQVGDLVPLARVGTKLPGGRAIEAANLRGVASQGMLCSQVELGVSEQGEGLWILPAGLKPGSPLAEALGLRDTVLELNVTPNRADCLSHLGVAREVAALTGGRLVPAPEPAKIPLRAAPGVALPPPEIEARQRCGLYLGQPVHGDRLNAESPPWLAARLRACGLRSIGLAVDVTNFVLLELGQPLHSFGLGSIRQGIRVRLARKGERLTTLDGVVRELSGEDLLICDGDRPIALAGVMGGAESGMPDAGSDSHSGSDSGSAGLYLEAAWFEPLGIRRTARRLGLHSDASHRYERGVDPELAPRALARALALLRAERPGLEIDPTQRSDGDRPQREPVRLRFAKVGSLLGHPVSEDEARGLLGRLEIREVGSAREVSRFSVPSYRFDLEREVDLIEEIARLQGFEKIGSEIPKRSIAPPHRTHRDAAISAVRRALSAQGFSEAINFSFLSGSVSKPFIGAERPVWLVNAIRVDQGGLRTSLLPSLCQNVRHNLAHLNAHHGLAPSVRLYELARVYRWPDGSERNEGPAQETLRLGLVAGGARSPIGWGAPEVAVDFYDLKGGVEALIQGLGIAPGEVQFTRAESPFLHPRSATTLSVGGRRIGVLGEIHPGVAEDLELPAELLLAELDAEPVFEAARSPRFAGLPRFPAVLRDLALVFPEAMEAAQVATALRQAGGDLLEDLALFDVYRGPPLGAGTKSLAFALRFRAAERTLTDEEVVALCGQMVASVAASLGGSLRA